MRAQGGVSIIEAAVALSIVALIAVALSNMAIVLRASPPSSKIEHDTAAASAAASLGSTLPPCPSSEQLTLGAKTYEVCVETTEQSQGSRFSATRNEVVDGRAALVWVEFAYCRRVANDTLGVAISRRGGPPLYDRIVVVRSPAVPLRTVRRVFWQTRRVFLGSTPEGSYIALSSPVTAGTGRIRIQWSGNLTAGVPYSFSVRLSGSGGGVQEWGFTCSVQW
jgi:hypothetical protein